MKHPKGAFVEFNKKKHKYNVNSEDFISITTLVNKFFPKFNRYSVSKRYAKKHGLSQEDVLKSWDDKQKRAAEIGNRCHKYANNLVRYLHNIEEKKIIKPYDIRFAIIADKLFELISKYSFVDSECLVYSLKFKIAGTFDLLFEDKHNVLYLYDWKFVEKLDIENKYQTGYNPIQYLDASKFNKYALQLNLYDFIINAENYFNEKRKCKKYILHVTYEDCLEINVPDMKKEVKNIILTKELTNGKNK